MDDDQQDQLEEVIEPGVKEENEQILAEAETLYTVEAAIRERISKLNEVREKMKELNEMVKSYLENDKEYVEASKAAKEAGARKSSIKQELMSRPDAKGLPDKIEDARDEKRELEESLSYYLAEFQRLSGTNEFEDENGELKQIVYVAKLVRRSGGN